jgi:hypothetical protein
VIEAVPGISKPAYIRSRATITGPQADLNLGIGTYVNGTSMNPVQIDTTQAATDTVQYVATDQSGLTSTSTRTVIIQAANDNEASTTSAANDNTPPLDADGHDRNVKFPITRDCMVAELQHSEASLALF